MMREDRCQPGLGANMQWLPSDKASLMYSKDRFPLIPLPFPVLSILDPDSHACEYSVCSLIGFVIIVAVCVHIVLFRRWICMPL